METDGYTMFGAFFDDDGVQRHARQHGRPGAELRHAANPRGQEPKGSRR